MDFVIIANQWDAHKDNPTSKHHVAMELLKKGHRVLWVNGTGMRAPSIWSKADRGRIWRKVREGLLEGKRQEARGKRGGEQERISHRVTESAEDAERSNEKTGVRGQETVNSKQWTDSTSSRQAVISKEGEQERISHGKDGRETLSFPPSGFRFQVSGFSPGSLEEGEISVLAPLVVPLPGSRIVRWINDQIYLRVIGKRVRECGFDKPVLINFLPTIPGVLKDWQWKSIYYCVDRWSAFPEYDAELMDRLDAECCRNADVVIASAKDLEKRCRRHNANTHLVLHGVDWEHWAKSEEQRAESEEQRAKGEEVRGGVFRQNGRIFTEGNEGNKGKTGEGVSSFDELRAGGKQLPVTSNQGSGIGSAQSYQCHQCLSVDKKSFSLGKGRPSDLPEGRIVGFFGHIGDWLDQELIVKLAKSISSRKDAKGAKGKLQVSGLRPQVSSIVLIGKVDSDVSRLKAEPNIYLLGQKDYAELPDYLAYFDVGLIPFVINDLTKALNPIKLREMMAAGVPVVSTDLPEVESVSQRRKGRQGVQVAGSHVEFIEMVKSILDNPLSAEEKSQMSESMAGETWSVKVDEILGMIGS